MTVTGTNFALGAGTTIRFGTTSATNAVCISATTCYAFSPAGSAGQVDVTATVNSAVSATSSADKFTYQ